MKESYNPFKMWGSYAGLVIGIITAVFNPIPAIIFDILKVCNYGSTAPCYGWMFIIDMTTGFLVGWGIHSICRRFSK